MEDPETVTAYLIRIFQYDGEHHRTHTSKVIRLTPTETPDEQYDYEPAEIEWTSIVTYDARGNVASSTDALGRTTYYNFDDHGNPLSITDALENTTYNTYDSNGNLIFTLDAEGGKTRYDYDSQGRLTQVVQIQEDGSEVVASSITYTANGLVSSSTSVTGFQQFFVYDDRGNQIISYHVWTDPTNASNKKTIVNMTTYDDNNRITASAQYELAGDDPITGLDDLASETPLWSTSTVYNEINQVETSTDQFGTVTENIYNSRGQLIQTRTQSRDENDQLVWITSRTVYDDKGRVDVVTDSYLTGQTIYATRYLYDSFGRTIQTERLKNVAITLAGTEPYRETELTSAGTLLSTTETHYDDEGRVDFTINADGVLTKYEYDEVGRQVRVIQDPDADLVGTTGDQIVTETEYDLGNRVIKTTDALGHETRYEYDKLGRQTAVISEKVLDPTTGLWVHIRTETVYDDLGRRVEVRENLKQTDVDDPRTIDRTAVRITNYEYDDAGRLTAVLLPEINNLPPINVNNPFLRIRPRYEYAYDSRGNQISILDPNGNETRFTYDHQGRQLTRTLPIGVASTGNPNDFVERFYYNDLGQLIRHVSFEERVTVYEYDNSVGSSGRLTRKEYFASVASWNNGAGEPDETVDYTYDAFGRVVETDDSAHGVTTNAFDDQGRLITVTSPEGTIHYEYDDASSRLTRTYTGLADTGYDSEEDDGKAITDTRYEYDDFGRLWKVIVAERNDIPLTVQEETTYRYDKVGNLDRTDQANGVIIDYVYDDLNRLDLLTHYASDANNEDLSDNDVLARFDYKVGTDGNRTGVVETNENGQITEVDWFYDEIGRLTREISSSFDNDLDFRVQYDYDKVGNRIVKWIDDDRNGSFENRIQYDYDANDRLTQERLLPGVGITGINTTVYEYGPGNAGTEQTKKTLRTGNITGGSWLSQTTQTFDVRGRLVKVEIDSDGDEDIDTTVDYVYNADGNRVEQTVTDHGASTTETTTYLVDANNQTGFSQVIEERLQGDLIKSFVIGHDVIAQAGPAATPIYFLLYDGHGSTRALTDETGALVAGQVYAYDAYGKAVGFETGDAYTTLLYSGEQTDSLTGMQYLRARYYDPSTGRFGSLDPFAGNNQDPLSLHKYAYAHMNPTMNTDPSGQFVGFVILAGLGAIVGGSIGGIDAYLGGDDIWQGVGWGAAGGAILGGGAFLAPAFFASSYVVGAGFGLGALSAFDAFRQGKNAQGAFRVFTGLGIPLALRSAAIARLASIAKTNLAALWKNIPLRANVYGLEIGVAGTYVSQRIPVAKAPPGRYIYVVDKEGRMWLAPIAANQKHSALVEAGAQVRTAGHIVIEPGNTARLNTRSGHYMFDKPILSVEEPAWLTAITETLLEAGIALTSANPSGGGVL